MTEPVKTPHPIEIQEPPEHLDRCPGCGEASDIQYRADLRERGWYLESNGCRYCDDLFHGPMAFCPDCGTALPEEVRE